MFQLNPVKSKFPTLCVTICHGCYNYVGPEGIFRDGCRVRYDYSATAAAIGEPDVGNL